jgi:hypothetical protein
VLRDDAQLQTVYGVTMMGFPGGTLAAMVNETLSLDSTHMLVELFTLMSAFIAKL